MAIAWASVAKRVVAYTLVFALLMGVRQAVYVPVEMVPSLELPDWHLTTCVVEDYAVTTRGDRWAATVWARFVDQRDAATIGRPAFYRPNYRSRDEANRDMALFTIGEPFGCFVDSVARRGDEVPALADFEIEWRERRAPDLFLWLGVPFYVLCILTLAMDPPTPETRGMDELIHPKTQ